VRDPFRGRLTQVSCRKSYLVQCLAAKSVVPISRGYDTPDHRPAPTAPWLLREGVSQGVRRRTSLTCWHTGSSDNKVRFRGLRPEWKRIAPTETKRASSRPNCLGMSLSHRAALVPQDNMLNRDPMARDAGLAAADAGCDNNVLSQDRRRLRFHDCIVKSRSRRGKRVRTSTAGQGQGNGQGGQNEALLRPARRPLPRADRQPRNRSGIVGMQPRVPSAEPGASHPAALPPT
jgi:hypothetical protein